GPRRAGRLLQEVEGALPRERGQRRGSHQLRRLRRQRHPHLRAGRRGPPGARLCRRLLPPQGPAHRRLALGGEIAIGGKRDTPTQPPPPADGRGRSPGLLPRGPPWGRSGGGRAIGVDRQARRPSSISIVTLTSSPTSSPPPSSAAFQLTSKSLRLIRVVALTPRFSLPQGSRISGDSGSTSSVLSRVMPRMVRSPVTSRCPPLPGSTRFERKVMVGYFCTSKKSGLRRCASRFSSRVLMAVASMVASTDDRVGSASSSTTWPVIWPSSPRTFETIRWRTLKVALEWDESMS